MIESAVYSMSFYDTDVGIEVLVNASYMPAVDDEACLFLVIYLSVTNSQRDTLAFFGGMTELTFGCNAKQLLAALEERPSVESLEIPEYYGDPLEDDEVDKVDGGVWHLRTIPIGKVIQLKFTRQSGRICVVYISESHLSHWVKGIHNMLKFELEADS